MVTRESREAWCVCGVKRVELDLGIEMVRPLDMAHSATSPAKADSVADAVKSSAYEVSRGAEDGQSLT